jgi:hypothetical protein
LRGSPVEPGIKPFLGYRPASASSLFVGPIEILETGICRHQTGERRHAHCVGYTMGYPSEHGVNLTFEINYLRVAVNPTLIRAFEVKLLQASLRSSPRRTKKSSES